MTITHVVMFSFKPLLTAAEVQDVCDRMLALKTKCVHPETKKPYIMAASGGRENSAANLQSGITHVFISEFENEADREYYNTKDPAHLEFVASLGSVVEKVQVVDFVHGAF